jgi:hypothetical protein
MCAWLHETSKSDHYLVLKFGIFLIYLQQTAVFIRVALSLIIGAVLMSKLNIFSLMVCCHFNRSV